MIVVDASAFTTALAYGDARGRRARSLLARDIEWAAPEHWKADVFSAVRGLSMGGHISDAQAARVVDRLAHVGVDQVPLDRLLPRMWQLRATLGASDAPYVALAEARSLTLLTADPALARAAVRHCRVELVV